jgi:two-component system, OmpR family, sensor histidine kinase CiaH
MYNKPKKIQSIFFIYWILLAYIIAALIFWFITLNNQNIQMSELRKQGFFKNTATYTTEIEKIEGDKQRKVKQYAGEGTTFLLVILAGALFFYKAIKRQLRLSQEQQNFMMAITHELKTPIAVAKLNLETIQKRKLDEVQQQRLLHNTLQETNRLDALCNNLLISSQIEAGGYHLEKNELDFTLLVHSCADDFISRYPQRMLEKNIEKEIYINGDALLIQIAINNLLENALKYSPKELPVRIQLSLNDAVAELQVIDNGPGIKDEEKINVFKKFYRLGNEATKRARGTGLGLYLTRKIVSNHGGNIFIQNNKQGGSIFTIQLAAIA